MRNGEVKSVPFELKDLDTGKRTAVIAHAVYNNIDRTKDISCKGMFDKTWRENKSIDFLFNHDDEQVPGYVVRTFDDEEKAYTQVKFGNWTLGNDVLEMAEAGVIKGASFGYVAEKKEYVTIKGEKIRKLKEVYHGETSLLTKTPANPLAGIVSLQKALYDNMQFKTLSTTEQQALKDIIASDQDVLQQLLNIAMNTDPKSDLYTWVGYAISRRADMMGDLRSQVKWNSGELKSMQEHANAIDKFCRNAKASDECIKNLQEVKENYEQVLSIYDTANTRFATEPGASINGKDLFNVIQQFKSTLNS